MLAVLGSAARRPVMFNISFPAPHINTKAETLPRNYIYVLTITRIPSILYLQLQGCADRIKLIIGETMVVFTFYMHTVSGDVAKLEDWRADYDSMDKEAWHGKPAEECDPDHWLADGLLEPVTLKTVGEPEQTYRDFEGCHGRAREGEKALTEWVSEASDNDGNQYRITWLFLGIKGKETETAALPWADETFVSGVETL